MTGRELKRFIVFNDVYCYNVAKKIGMSEQTLIRRFRLDEVPTDLIQQVKPAIKELTGKEPKTID